MKDNSENHDISLLDDGDCDGYSSGFSMEYDEDGSLALARSLNALHSSGESADSSSINVPTLANKPCKVGVLNGSWYLQLRPQGAHSLMEIRGPMRIEVASPKLRISGDIYVKKPAPINGAIEILRPITEKPLIIGKNWYPQFTIEQYSWYFRSLGVTYQNGKLVFKFERNLWNQITQEFIQNDNSGKDTGFMELECREANRFIHPLLPQPTIKLTGIARLGGETYEVIATKTSPFYRGCAVEVDVMTNRSFPLSAMTINGSKISFESIYRTAGIDCQVKVDQNNLPDDSELTNIELQTALTTNRRPAELPDAWRLWLLVGSSQGGLFGIMFDDIEPFREGTAGFFDPEFGDDPTIAPSARNRKLGEVPEAFLRTLVHEAGHAFNLFHPKHDVHVVPIGTSIMNQTGDVMSFATVATPYPNNVTFAFDAHSRASLIHSPDPQVAPGWKRFGWGHGGLSSGIAEPVDAAGLLRNVPVSTDFSFELIVPELIYRGQFVTGNFKVTNTGKHPRAISAALNLSQGDLRLLLKPPMDELHDVRDVILACGDRPLVVLQPGESIIGNAQIFYTNVGHTFRQTGRYFISAEFEVGDLEGTVVRSNTVTVIVRAPDTQEEEAIAQLTMDLGVGRAFAFGDFGTDHRAKEKLEELANKYGQTETGAAASLTLANSFSRDLRDLYSKNILRVADQTAADNHFDSTAKEHSAKTLVQLATAVAAPTEGKAPILEQTQDYLQKNTTGVSSGAADGSGGDAASADSGKVKDALSLLNEIRQTYPN
ncbi:MAG TPA: hypothetical protein VGC97_10060 [Pyrinomonadaceae bacterium]|jgi:hypothetical protein